MSVCTLKLTLLLKSTVCIQPRRAIPASSDNRTSEQTSNRPKRTMISPRSVYFVYFALIFGTPPAKATDNNNSTPIKPTPIEPTNNKTPIEPTNNKTPIEPTDNNTTSIEPTDNNTTSIEPTVNNTTPIEPTVNNTTPIEPTNNKTPIEPTDNNTTPIKPTDNNTIPIEPTDNNNNTTPIKATPTSNNNKQTTKLNSAATTNKLSFCTQTTPKPKEGHRIFSLPIGEDNLILIVVALTVGCLALLLTTLICTCQVCHLRGIISSLQHHNGNTDQHAKREKSESPCRDEGQGDGQPTETCLMLSEVTAAQEESREYEMNNTEPPVKHSNGDITQENSLDA